MIGRYNLLRVTMRQSATIGIKGGGIKSLGDKCVSGINRGDSHLEIGNLPPNDYFISSFRASAISCPAEEIELGRNLFTNCSKFPIKPASSADLEVGRAYGAPIIRRIGRGERTCLTEERELVPKAIVEDGFADYGCRFVRRRRSA